MILQSPHTVTTDPSEINSANYNQPSLQKDEAILTNRNATSSILREHIQKLEELYKRVVYQCEENRLKYWIALNELENCRIFQKVNSLLVIKNNLSFTVFRYLAKAVKRAAKSAINKPLVKYI